MILDDETFGELVGHLGRVSEAILKTARHVAALSNDASSEETTSLQAPAEKKPALLSS